MADWRDELENAREEARRAREEAQRLRDEAKELERQLRHEERTRSREERHRDREARLRVHLEGGPRGPHAPQPPGIPPLPAWAPESAEGARAEQDFSLEGVTTVHVDQTAGRVTVRPCREGETPGVVSSGNKSAPARGQSRRRPPRHRGQARYWLALPPQAGRDHARAPGPRIDHLRLDLGYGEAHPRIDSESIRLDVGAGTITTAQTSGHLRANVGAGNRHPWALRPRRLRHRHRRRHGRHFPARPGEYRIDAGIGRAEYASPRTVRSHQASSGMGKTRIDYPGAPEGAPTSLRINTGVGEVSVKARVPGEEAPSGPPPAQAKPQRGVRTTPQPRRREAEELRVLQLLEQGRITSQDAADLIAALQGAGAMPAEGEDLAEPPPADEPAPGEPSNPAPISYRSAVAASRRNTCSCIWEMGRSPAANRDQGEMRSSPAAAGEGSG
jgi:hypothetical protein